MSEASFLQQVRIRRFRGDEPIGDSGKTVVEFWRWSSDLLENVQRGIFAEYVVATALDVADQTHVGWNGYDLRYGEHKIEVKSSAYLQSWKQRVLSRPVFGIGARKQWDEKTGLYSDPVYVADIFVFCLFAHHDPVTADILDLRQWQFFVVHTKTLKELFSTSRSISEGRLRLLTLPVTFGSLQDRIDSVLREPRSFLLPGKLARKRLDESVEDARYTYAVAQRGTRVNPVVVIAADHQEAFERARVNETICSYGRDISAVRLSQAKLQTLLANGAKDLR